MNPTTRNPKTPDSGRGNPGPWGDLELVRIVISPPLQFVGDIPIDEQAPRWRFSGGDMAAAEEWLLASGLSSDDVRRLLATARADDAHDALVLSPTEELIRGLPAETRRDIYNLLGLSPLNPQLNNAFRYCGESLDDWFRGAPLSPRTAELVDPFLYRNGAFLFFADFSLAAREIADPEERQRLVKALSREATVLVKLRLTPASDVEQLVAYWSHGRRHKDIRPLLESLAACPQGEVLDVVHLLPPFARRLLYTYPHPPQNTEDTCKDCHWTSLNFFHEPPDNRFLDLEAVVQTIAAEYVRVQQEVTFGDLVIYCSPQGEVFHSAIYIADDITFTKQGSTVSRPWMFMKLDQLPDFYPRREPVEVRFYRRRQAN